MIYLSYFIIGALLVVLVILAVPISLGYDSVGQCFKVRWLGLTVTRRLATRKSKKYRASVKKLRESSHGLAVMKRFWQKRDLVAELLNRVGRFALEVVKTFRFRDTNVTFSLPDPMWNGVLYGALTGIRLEQVNLSVNFEQCNYAKIWVTVYPHRVARQLAALLLRLPYLRILRFARELKRQAKRS